MKSPSLWSLVLLVASGCQAGTPTFEGDTFLPPGSDVGSLRQALATKGDGPNGAHIIFLNYDGQQITRSNYDNPDTGASSIATTNANFAAFDATPYKASFTPDAAKNAITNYFKQFYAPFNIQVVTARPSGVRYTMCLVGDNASTVLGGGSGSAAGVAPLDCDNNNEEEITYAFAAGLAPRSTGLSLTESLKSIAVTAAQETAHSFGLSHTNSTQDIMYPQLDLSQNAFVDSNMGLINNPGGACHGASSQNSKQLLGGIVGFSNGSMPTGPSPTVKFVAPGNNATVPLAFTIIVSASEAGGTIDHVDISSGSQTLFTWKTPPYRDDVMAPSEGMFQITATAFDTAGNFQSAAVTFNASKSAPPQVLPPCASSDECPSGQMCTSGMCVASGGTTTGGGTNGAGTNGSNTGGTSGSILTGIGTGQECTENPQCQGQICYTSDPDRHSYCSNFCDPAVASSCPSGMSCVSYSGANICEYPPGGSGCATAPGSPAHPAFGFFLLFGVIALLRLRRARG